MVFCGFRERRKEKEETGFVVLSGRGTKNNKLLPSVFRERKKKEKNK
jgi:hypothetical protein